MYCSNSYKLECESISNLKKFQTLHNISLLLRIFSLLSLILLIWKIWLIAIPVALYATGTLLSSKAFSMVFSYEYWIDGDLLKVTKYYKNNKVKELVSLPIRDEFVCAIMQRADIDYTLDKCYIDRKFDAEMYLRIVWENQTFYIISDKYFYSLLTEGK